MQIHECVKIINLASYQCPALLTSCGSTRVAATGGAENEFIS